MKRLLLNCDQVFEVLTRGPFPTGAAGDMNVEQHLRACHDCRQLAEALRPAVELLHEAVSDGEALDLPEYHGALACDLPGRRRSAPLGRAQARSIIPPRPPLDVEPLLQPRARREAAHAGALRYVAASLAAALLAIAAGGVLLGPTGSPSLAGMATSWLAGTGDAALADGLPSDRALLTLASLELPATCLPLTHRPTAPARAEEIAAALAAGSLDALRCCTECHHAGLAHGAPARLMAALGESCRACHRG